MIVRLLIIALFLAATFYWWSGPKNVAPTTTTIEASDRQPKNGQFKIFIDSKNGYRLRYPSGWILRNYPHSTDLVKADIISPDGQTGINIRVYPKKKDFATFIKSYLESFCKQMQEHWKGKLVELERFSGKIGKCEGFSITFDFQRPTSRYFLKQYLWPDHGKVFVFQCGAPYDSRDKKKQTLDQIAASFEIIRK